MAAAQPLLARPLSSTSSVSAPRQIDVNLAQAAAPMDRAFDLSVGSDFAGTLSRADSLAQLSTTVDELGFRYVRFHAPFHDALKTVQVQDGRIIYDWTGLDRLFDALLARRIVARRLRCPVGVNFDGR
jgi:xylan 1,4-beta-xylosidase